MEITRVAAYHLSPADAGWDSSMTATWAPAPGFTLTPAPQAECRSLTFSANFRNSTLARCVRGKLSDRSWRKNPWRHLELDSADAPAFDIHADRIRAALVHKKIGEEDCHRVHSRLRGKVIDTPGSLGGDAVDDDRGRAKV